MSDTEPSVIANPWQALRQFTQARIALGRSGVSLPTAAQLEFQLAHARARDAVHLALDAPALAASLAGLGLPSLTLHSAAADRNTYLQRPDLGRRLDAPSRAALEQAAVEQAAVEPPALKQPAVERSVMKQPGAAAQAGAPAGGYDLALVVADGLSALAIEQNVLPFLTALLARLSLETWSLAPLAIVEQGRVAIGDEVGEVMGARAVLVLIGERPGLSSPDSMGLYLTWSPRVGLLDDSRNCISNVRPAGLSYDDAAYKMHYLLSEARRRGLSGVALKDETPGQEAALDGAPRNFLIG